MKAAWLFVLCGCASGSRDVTADASNVDAAEAVDAIHSEVDAALHADATTVDGALPDSAVLPDAFVPDAAIPPDAFVPDAFVMPDAAIMADAAVDAMIPVDAACVPVTTEILLNPAFDLTPRGVNWTESSDLGVDLITDDSGQPAAQSPPYRAWMGGYTDGTDQLYQNITIPANTTKLELTGFYAVGTGETGSTAFDTADVAIVKTNGTIVEDTLQLSNLSKTSGWVALDHVYAQNLSGQSLRLRFTETNDSTLETSFFFDTLSLKATHCP